MSNPKPETEGLSSLDRLPCPRCGKPVECGMRAGQKTCWCFDLPQVMAVPAAGEDRAACLCEACLKKVIAEAGMKPLPSRDQGKSTRLSN